MEWVDDSTRLFCRIRYTHAKSVRFVDGNLTPHPFRSDSGVYESWELRCYRKAQYSQCKLACGVQLKPEVQQTFGQQLFLWMLACVGSAVGAAHIYNDVAGALR